MKRGISPVIAVVLLVSISVIAGVGAWYWVSELASKPAGVDPDQRAISVEDCDPNTNQIRVRDVTGKGLNKNVSIYSPDGEIGVLDFEENPLSIDEIKYMEVDLEDGEELEPGVEYKIVGEVPVVTFTC